MKTNKILLITLAALLLVNVGLAVYAGSLKHRLNVLQGDADDYVILDTAEPSASEQPAETDARPETDKGKDEGRTATVVEDTALESSIEQILSGAGGSWDVWAESLNRSTFSHVQLRKSSDPMVSASLIKLFIMGTVYQAVEEGSISNSEVYQDIRSMITISDNEAANRLIRKLGSGNEQDGLTRINQFAEDIGCLNTQINRVMLAENGLENYTTAEDCARILKLIYSGTCVNEKWSAEMLDCLKGQQVNDRIPQGVPSGTVVAHKTANLTNSSNADVGIVFADSGPYIICVINNDSPNDSITNEQITAVSQTVYKYYQS